MTISRQSRRADTRSERSNEDNPGERASSSGVDRGDDGAVVPIRTSYDIRLKQRALEQAQRIASTQQITEGEAVKRALAVMDFVQTEVGKGSCILVQDASGHTREVQFVFG